MNLIKQSKEICCKVIFDFRLPRGPKIGRNAHPPFQTFVNSGCYGEVVRSSDRNKTRLQLHFA